VYSLEGVYIANVGKSGIEDFRASNRKVENVDLNVWRQTVITFDKGGMWGLLPAPFRDSNGKRTYCVIGDGC
jgi:hypothetical protein